MHGSARPAGLARDAAWAAVGGAAQAASLADPWSRGAHGWLQIAGLALLYAVLARTARRGGGWARGAVLGGVFALVWLAGTFWWLFISMHVYGGLAGWLAALGVGALAAFLALYYAGAGAAFCACVARSGSGGERARDGVLFASLWTLAELARGTWFTGFPWGAGGYAHVDGWLAGLAPWVGVYGIGWAGAWLASVCAQWLAGTRGPGAMAAMAPRTALAAALVAVALWVPAWQVVPGGDGPPVDVALLQGNIAQDEKFVASTGVADALAWYGRQLAESEASLVVTPETALAVLPSQLPRGYWQALQQRFATGGQAALVGIPLGSAAAGYTNSVVGLVPGEEQPYRYDKHHLVPFGEFIPPMFRWFTNLMHIPLGDFNRGGLPQPPMHWRGERLAPNICYEDLFGEEIARQFLDPERAPTALVNASNIAWFGDTVAIDQHLAISRMRAMEFDRPVLRATNTGATAIIDRHGRVRQRLPSAERAVLAGTFSGRSGLTAYAWWSARWGLLPLALACALLALDGTLRGALRWRRV